MSTSYSSVNALDEFTIIGGTDFTLRFSITDEDGLPVDLTSSTLLLKIAPYGQPGSVITTLTGSVGTTTDIAEYVLPATTSEGMVGGKYMYQPIIEDSASKIHRPKQGVFLLVQAIGNFADVIDVPSSAYYIYGTGTNAYSSTNTSITSYYAGLSIILYVQNTNTVNATLVLAGVVGTKGLMKFNSVGAVVSLIAGDLLANKKYLFVYDGTNWVMVGRCNSEIDHAGLMNIGSNTHAQIDTFIEKANTFIDTTVPTNYAPLASPTFTGDPKAPTPTTGDNDTSIATTAFVYANSIFPTDYKSGMKLSRTSSTQVTVGTGSIVIADIFYKFTSALTATISVPGSNTLYHLYVYDNAGTKTVEASTTAPVAASFGTAYYKTGATTRRYVGTVLSTAANGIERFVHSSMSGVFAYSNVAAPKRVLATGTDVTKTTVSVATVIPITGIIANILVINTDSTRNVIIVDTDDVTLLTVPPGSRAAIPAPLDGSNIYYKLSGASVTGGAFIDVLGYSYIS